MADLRIKHIFQVALAEIARLGLPVPRYLEDSEKSSTILNPPNEEIKYSTENIIFIYDVKAFGNWVNGEYHLVLKIIKTYTVDIGWDYLHAESPYRFEVVHFGIRYKEAIDKESSLKKWGDWQEGPELPISHSFVAPLSKIQKKLLWMSLQGLEKRYTGNTEPIEE